MNDWDRDNLEFIMNCGDEEFFEWLEQCDDDDVEYALQLIQLAKAELMEQTYDVINRESERVVLKSGKYPEAQEVLNKFTLGNNK